MNCSSYHLITKLDSELTEKLEKLHTSLKCSKIIVNSGYRCPTHDKNDGGNGSDQHVNGTADIVCCAAQYMGFTRIANTDKHTRQIALTSEPGSSSAMKLLLPLTAFVRIFIDISVLQRLRFYGVTAQTKKNMNVTLTVDGVTYEEMFTEK